MNYIKVTIKDFSELTPDILIALLADISFESFEEEQYAVHAYIQESTYDEDILKELLNTYNINYEISTIEQQNWNQKWEDSFEPVIIDKFCVIRAPFHDKPNDIKYDIVITPKMSFGTGHHATTRLMISAMEQMTIADMHILDFGTGTGVLAILSQMMGASDIMAIDNDEWSYENTIENVEQNDVATINIAKGSLEVANNRKYNIILANINRHILLEYMQQMNDVLLDNGKLLMSGFLVDDIPVVQQSAEKAGLRMVSTHQDGYWAAMLVEK